MRVGLSLGGHPFSAYMLTPCRLDALAAGGFLALGRPGRGGLRRARPAARKVFLASGLVLAGSIARAHGVFYHLDPWNRTVGYTLLAAFFGSLLVMAVTDGPDRALGRFFRGRVLRFLGKYSYGLYVYHFLLLPTFRA